MLSHLAQIPLVELQHEAQEVSFAIKLMSEIEDAHDGKIEPPHRHNFYALIWLLSGEGQHVIDFIDHELAENQIYFLAPGQVHQLLTKSKPQGWVILFTRDFVQQQGWAWNTVEQLGLFDACQQLPPLVLNMEQASELDPLFKTINQEFLGKAIDRDAILASYLRIVLTKLFRFKQLVEKPLLTEKSEITSSRQQATVQQFNLLIERHHQTVHQVGQYADFLSVSSGYLNELIKSHTGRTAKDVIMDRLLLAAKREALFSDKSSKEVAFMLGFEDPAHFSKFFKTGTTVTFMAFRQQVRKNSSLSLDASQNL